MRALPLLVFAAAGLAVFGGTLIFGSIAFDPGIVDPGLGRRGLHLLAHVAASLLVLALARRLRVSRPAAWAAGLVFLLHPLQVDGVIRSSETRLALATTCWLACIVAWNLFREKGAGFRLLAAWLLGVVATALHPFAAIHPLVLAGHDRLLVRRDGSNRFGRAGPLALSWVGAAAGVVLGRFLPFASPTDPIPLAPRGSLGLEPGLWPLAIRNLVLPLRTSLLYEDVGGRSAVVAGIAVGIATLAAVGLVLVRRRVPRLGFAAILFLAPLAMRFGFLPGDGAALADRYFYAPLAGAALAFAVAIDGVARLGGIVRVATTGAVAVGLVVVGVESYHKARVLADPVRAWRQAAARFPGSPRAELGLGEALLGLSSERADGEGPRGGTDALEEAVQVLERADRAARAARRPDPDLVLRILRRRILALEALARDEDALALRDEEIRLLGENARPDSARQPFADALRGRGRLLARLGRFEEAKQGLEQALGWCPTDAASWVELARIERLEAARLDREGDGERASARRAEAVRAVERAEALDPGNLDAKLERGEALRGGGDYIGAVRAFEDAARIEPSDAGPHLQLARLYFGVGNLAEASREIEIALRLVPSDAEALLLLADVLAAQGRRELADRTVESAFLAHGERPEVRQRWAGVLLRRGEEAIRAGDADAAADRITVAIQLGADGCRARRLLGEAEAARKRFEEAAKLYERALAEDAEDPSLLREVALFYKDFGYTRLVEGRRDEALRAFRRAVELLGDDPDVAVIRRILEEE